MTMTLVQAKRVSTSTHPKTVTDEVLAAQAGDYPLRTWRFSWDKDEHTFHLRDGDLNLYVIGIEGHTFIDHTDAVSGRMFLTHRLVLDDKGNGTFINEDAEGVVSDAPAHQMCFARAEHKWRIWRRPDDSTPFNERRDVIDSTRKTVSDYRGPLHVFWPREDQGGHVFTTTPFEISEGMALF